MKPELIVALDLSSEKEALELATELMPAVDFFKVGWQLFLAAGYNIIQSLNDINARVFLDLKFHDIPNQISGAINEAVKMRVKLLTLHTSGGSLMMSAAAASARKTAAVLKMEPPKLLGVTVLTSSNNDTLREQGFQGSIDERVLRLARLAALSGLDGVVASGQEAAGLRREMGPDFLIVTPGIRSKESPVQDQKRAVTPKSAVAAGADYLVVGRPVTMDPHPRSAAENIIKEIERGDK